MQLAYIVSLFIFFTISFSQDQLYTYDRMKDSLYSWQEQYGNTSHPSNDYSSFGIIYSLDSIGYSSNDNLPIYAVKLSANVNSSSPEPKVLILGQCHAEEIYGVEIAMEIINQFLHPEQYQENKAFLQNGLYFTELWIVPTYNPEGLRVVHGYLDDGETIKDVTYRKNKRDTDSDGIFDYVDGIGQDTDGVDLNRNYDFNWVFGDTLLQPCTGDCSYADDGEGGGIFLMEESYLSLNRSIIANNYVEEEVGYSIGGGINSSMGSSLDIINSTINGNTANNVGGIAFSGEGFGANGSLNIINSIVWDNGTGSIDGDGVIDISYSDIEG